MYRKSLSAERARNDKPLYRGRNIHSRRIYTAIYLYIFVIIYVTFVQHRRRNQKPIANNAIFEYYCGAAIYLHHSNNR